MLLFGRSFLLRGAGTLLTGVTGRVGFIDVVFCKFRLHLLGSGEFFAVDLQQLRSIQSLSLARNLVSACP